MASYGVADVGRPRRFPVLRLDRSMSGTVRLRGVRRPPDLRSRPCHGRRHAAAAWAGGRAAARLHWSTGVNLGTLIGALSHSSCIVTTCTAGCATGRAGVLAPTTCWMDARRSRMSTSPSIALVVYGRNPITGRSCTKAGSAGMLRPRTAGCTARRISRASHRSSPDGRTVYVSGPRVVVFDRNPTLRADAEGRRSPAASRRRPSRRARTSSALGSSGDGSRGCSPDGNHLRSVLSRLGTVDRIRRIAAPIGT